MKRERNMVCCSTYLCIIGCFLYVPWPRIKPPTLVYQDDVLSNWDAQQGFIQIFLFLFFLGKYLWVKLLGDRVGVCLVLQEIVRLFSALLVNIISLPTMDESPSYSAFSSALGIVGLLKFSYSGEYGMISHCGFYFHFLHDW